MPANGRWDLIRRLKVNSVTLALPLTDYPFTALEHTPVFYGTCRRVPERFKSLKLETMLRHVYIQHLPPPDTRKALLCLNIIISPQ